MSAWSDSDEDSLSALKTDLLLYPHMKRRKRERGGRGREREGERDSSYEAITLFY